MASSYVITCSVWTVLVPVLAFARHPDRSALLLVPTPTAHNPPTILDRVARGEPGATEECLSRYADLVWSVARRLSGGSLRADAEDAVQEIFVDLWRSSARFDPSVASEAAFVVMIARRRLIDRIRRSARRPATGQLGDAAEQQPSTRGADTAERLTATEDAAIAIKTMESLADEQQRCIRLAVQHGCTHTQISEITGLPLGTVKTHVRRGLLRVREAIEAKAAAAPSGAGRRA